MKTPSLDRLGKPGILALGLLLFCLSFYLGHLGPARTELQRLQDEASRLKTATQSEQRDHAPAPGGLRQRPPFTSVTATLKELNALAGQYGLSVERSTYLLSDKEGQQRLEIALPLKTSYPPLRAYLRALLALPAAPVLDGLTLQRQKSGDPQIDAELRLSYYFAPAP